MITGRIVSSDESVGTTGKDTIIVTTQGESVTKLSGGKRPVTITRMLCELQVKDSLVSVSSCFDDNEITQFMNSNYDGKKSGFVVDVDYRVGDVFRQSTGRRAVRSFPFTKVIPIC